MEAPIKYAKSGDAHLAYRIFGDGPRDMVLVPGTLSHAELTWERPSVRHLLKRLTAFARVIVFDQRGQGLSDRVAPAELTLEERIADIRAVMDAASSERATIYGWSEGGPASLMFSATYPERTVSLVLYGTFASVKDPPWSKPREQWKQMLSSWENHWGEGVLLEVNAPSMSGDEAARRMFGRLERASASPGSILALMRANIELDVRHILPAIRVPALILHRTGDVLVPVECGRYLAQNIPGAKFTELSGTDHSVLDNETQDVIADQIEDFITGTHRRMETDRVVATVMFTDIVGSTERAAGMGDQRWRELLGDWYAVIRKELSAFRGREIDTAGDGVLATFDGPARAVRCASSICQHVQMLGLQVRTGLHTGECELAGDNVVGIAVHIAARVAAIAGSNEVLVSRTVKDLVAGSGLTFGDRGAHTLKGVPDEWQLYVVN
jgi:pimeloyl-ACP methyl ester carboxylesterase